MAFSAASRASLRDSCSSAKCPSSSLSRALWASCNSLIRVSLCANCSRRVETIAISKGDAAFKLDRSRVRPEMMVILVSISFLAVATPASSSWIRSDREWSSCMAAFRLSSKFCITSGWFSKFSAAIFRNDANDRCARSMIMTFWLDLRRITGVLPFGDVLSLLAAWALATSVLSSSTISRVCWWCSSSWAYRSASSFSANSLSAASSCSLSTSDASTSA